MASASVGSLTIHGETFVIETDQRVDLVDLTNRIMDFARRFKIREGLVSLWSMHTTCAIFINEFQTALLTDIKAFLEKMVDRDEEWLHNNPDHSDCDRMNADAHLRALLLGHSLTLQISGGEVVLGQWQRILMAELDGPRARSLRIQVFGISVGQCVRRPELRSHARGPSFSSGKPPTPNAPFYRASASTPASSRSPTSWRPASGSRSPTASASSSRRICWRSAGWPTASARSGTARGPTTTTTSGSKRRTSASPRACSARSPGCGPGDPGSYTLSLEEAWDKLRRRAHQPLTEVHVVNGLHPDLPFDYYKDLLRGFKRIRPEIHLKCFTAVEIAFFADLYGMTDVQVLRELMDAGLDSLPGGGAEVFAERVRRKICHDKADADRYLSIHRTAHRLGMRSNVTMLYGHIETFEERVDHMLRTRALQDETGGVQAFIPLAFHPDNNQMRKLPAPSAADTLRVHAVSRLMLDNIPHVKAFWIATGVEVAQTALWFGVDDLDGTVQEEKIYHMAGSRTPESMTTADLQRLIRAAGRSPVERDTLYNVDWHS